MGLVDIFGMTASDAYNNLCAGEDVECKLNIGEFWTAANAVRMPSIPIGWRVTDSEYQISSAAEGLRTKRLDLS